MRKKNSMQICNIFKMEKHAHSSDVIGEGSLNADEEETLKGS
jgi:hypothetical protein